MREFVGHQASTPSGARREFATGKCDVSPQRERAGADGSGGRPCIVVGMDADAGEVAAEARLEECSLGGGQGSAGAEVVDGCVRRWRGGGGLLAARGHGRLGFGGAGRADASDDVMLAAAVEGSSEHSRFVAGGRLWRGCCQPRSF